MADFVINEWLWADLSGENGPKAQLESVILIEKFAKSPHRLIVIEGSAFDKKAWNLCKNTNPMIVQRTAGVYVATIRQSFDRCCILKPETVNNLPEGLIATTKDEDHYLLQAQVSVVGAILVTTDNPLREAVSRFGYPCLRREELLATYFAN
jgi:hypothetical protein